MVNNLGKCYRMYVSPAQRLLGLLTGDRIGRYREHWALQDVSFVVPKGKTVGIIGENGAGKSTLLQMVAGTLTPTRGSVQTSGRVAALLELGAGFNPEYSGRENVFMTGSLYGLTREEIAERLPEIERFAEIGDYVDQPVKTYSSGMFVRLAFAVIAHVDANVLIIDEALAVGDAYFTQKCMRFLNGFMDQGSVLFVSHDIAAVRALSDEVLWIDCGRLRLQGDPKAVGDEYLEAIYARSQPVGRSAAPKQVTSPVESTDFRADCRAEKMAATGNENRIEISPFAATAEGFGDGAATIVGVSLTRVQGGDLPGVVGGEEVELSIKIRAHRDINCPIVGFFLRNRFGQNVFGDNTLLAFSDQPRFFPAATSFSASFTFRMPFLPPADYSLCVAVASGTAAGHVQHHWLNEAMIIRSISSNVHADVIGIPMHRMTLEASE